MCLPATHFMKGENAEKIAQVHLMCQSVCLACGLGPILAWPGHWCGLFVFEESLYGQGERHCAALGHKPAAGSPLHPEWTPGARGCGRRAATRNGLHCCSLNSGELAPWQQLSCPRKDQCFHCLGHVAILKWACCRPGAIAALPPLHQALWNFTHC